MKLCLAGVGKLKSGPERDLFDRYSGRGKALCRPAGLTGLDIVEIGEGRARTADERKRSEASALSQHFMPGAYVVLLDERGGSLDSQAFAALIGGRRDAGLPGFVVAVGGPDGFDPAFRDRAHATLAFGAATLPHQLVRVLAAEQVYRALTILTGHPYHRV